MGASKNVRGSSKWQGVTQKTLTYDELKITTSDVFEQMGWQGSLPDGDTCREAEAVIEEVRGWLRPQFCYVVVNELPAFDFGQTILGQLSGSEAFALFIATAGVEYEQYQRKLTDNCDMVRVFMADALGSVIAEKCADRLEAGLQESIDKLGWHHTNRFSPGYCGWHVREQQLLFSLFQGNTCGVTLNDSSLMLPIKSVSGIIGLGKKVRRMDYSCGLCTFEKCYKRHRR